MKTWKKIVIAALGLALIVLLRAVIGRTALLLLVSATLAYLLYPIMHLMEHRLHWGEGLSSVMAFALVVAALLVFLLFGIPALVRQLGTMGQEIPVLWENFSSFLLNLTNALTEMGLPEEALASISAKSGDLLTLGAQFLYSRFKIVYDGVRNLGYLIFSPVLAFYMLRDRRRLFSFLQRLLPSKWREPVLKVCLSVRDAVAAYVHGQLTVSMITGALTGLGLLLIGLPSWLAMGVLMMVFNLIPYFGPWLGMIPIIIFSITEGFPMVLGGVLVVLAAQQIEGLVVTPRVIGSVASLHPALVVLCLLVGGWIAGLPGMFYSIPAAVSLRAVLRALSDAHLHK